MSKLPMNKLVLCLFLLISSTSRAQNWQCVQPGVKRYFTNSNHYLRGIRIDSVKVIGTDTVLFPFHTIRGDYSNSPHITDPKGGSWLGKTIIEKPDGTTLFSNYRNDSVVIKSRANLLDTWILYDDTSSIFYVATVTSVDTLTVLGSLDSIKTITISAMTGSGILNTDPINNSHIKLSKNNGFLQVVDLYMLPGYYKTKLDYFFDEAKTPLFYLTTLPIPDLIQVNDYNVGDILETRIDDDLNYSDPKVTYILDNIIQKTIVSPTQVQYLSNRIREITKNDFSKPYPPTTTTDFGVATLNFYSNKIIDSNFLPEETNNHFIYYYNPVDTSFCYSSPSYGIHSNLRDAWEPCGSDTVYKIGFGGVFLSKCTGMGPPTGYGVQLVYAEKNAAPCGQYYTLNTETVNKSQQISISPNPCSDVAIIQFPQSSFHNIELVNAFGQVLRQLNTDKQTERISVLEIPNGIYYLSIFDEAGVVNNQKLVVQH